MFPFIMAGIFKLFGWNFYNVQIFNILISAFSCVLVYFITSKLFGRFAGIVAGTIFAFYHLFIFYCNYLQTEILYIFFMSLFLYLAIKLLKNPSMKTNIISALCFVFAYYTRIEILSLLPFILFWIMLDNKVFNKQKLKYICMFCLVFFLALAPWIIRNYIIHHTFVMGTTNMGISLYIGNNQ
ncbi:MAG: ArnT family glycosyltransferase [Candidatus Aminicenantaceae bacterium]